MSGLLSGLEAKISANLEDAGPLAPVMEYLSRTPGKRIRPMLTILAREACSALTVDDLRNRGDGRDVSLSDVADDDTVLEIASAIELIHMASLVHDDIIDNARERRGKPTVHSLWGIHSAVLAGDYLFTRANKIALRYPRYAFASLFNQTIELTCEGETYQDERLFDPDVTRKEYFSFISKKTAALMGAACQAGAALANATGETENAFLRFGIELGCAFQIADDVLDFVADPIAFGKETCNDLRRGLLTLPTILAMDSGLGHMIRDAFRARSVRDDFVARVRDGLAAGGHLDMARAIAKDLAISARSRLGPLPPSRAKATLGALAHKVVASMDR